MREQPHRQYLKNIPNQLVAIENNSSAINSHFTKSQMLRPSNKVATEGITSHC